MAKKYYAVRAGRKTGIFETWDECRAQTTGFKGASFKSFPTRAEAEAYMQGADSLVQSGQAAEGEAVAYVDGSYHSGTNAFSCGSPWSFASCMSRPSSPSVKIPARIKSLIRHSLLR